MKNVLILCCFSLILGRAASYNVVVVSPVESYLQKKQLEVSKVDAGSENYLGASSSDSFVAELHAQLFAL